MEYQRILNLFDKNNYQLCKFRTENWVEVNGKSHKMYNSNCQIKFKTKIVNPCLCYCRNKYILVKGTLRVVKKGANAEAIKGDRSDRQVIFKNCAS